jgi:hypothetical protein
MINIMAFYPLYGVHPHTLSRLNGKGERGSSGRGKENQVFKGMPSHMQAAEAVVCGQNIWGGPQGDDFQFHAT